MGREIPVAAESGARASSSASLVAMDLDVSPETDAELARLAREIGGTKVDAIKYGLALLNLAVDARNRGRRLAFVGADGQIDTEITGL